ncbi:MAG: phosphoserine phosphatase [Thermoplasmata archaeon]|nr:phosphoserine phosphatase [Thermoplasmata archaeon]
MALKLVSFDLDGTLIHPAIFNAVADPLGFGDKLEETTRLYFAGKMSADETFHADYKHFVGREVAPMHEALRASDRWTPGLAEAIERLHGAGLRVAVTTDQPDWLVAMTREMFGVDDLVCSQGDVRHGRVAGSYHLAHDKWANLQRLLRARRIDPREACHVGNGRNDVPVFRSVGWSLAVWPMHADVAAGAAEVLEEPRDAGEIADRVLAAAQRMA